MSSPPKARALFVGKMIDLSHENLVQSHPHNPGATGLSWDTTSRSS